VPKLNPWCAAACLTLALGSAPLYAADDKPCDPADCVRTAYGLLELKSPGEGASALSLDGDALTTFDRSARFRAAYPESGEPSLVLVEMRDAKSCAMYRVLEMKSKDEVRLGAEFGNCQALVADSERERYGVAQSILFENGEWRFALAPPHHDNSGAQDTHAEWYAYREGKIYQSKVVAGKSADPEAAALKNLEAEVPDKEKRDALIHAHGSAANAYRWLLLQKGLELDPRKGRRK
jgi:hypothetical protein